MSTLTPWFPGNTRPVRAGVYQVYRGASRPLYARFENRAWFFTCSTVNAARRAQMISGFQPKTWRGLAQPATIVK